MFIANVISYGLGVYNKRSYNTISLVVTVADADLATGVDLVCIVNQPTLQSMPQYIMQPTEQKNILESRAI